MCVCVCVRVFLYMYLYIYIHDMCIYINMYTCMCANMFICISAYMFVNAYIILNYCMYMYNNIYTVKMEVRMPARIPNFPPPQLECGSRTAKNPSVRMPSHPGFKFFLFLENPLHKSFT